MSRFKGKPKIDRYIRPDEFKALLEAAKDDDDVFFFIRVMGATGIRSIEAEGLVVGKVDYSRRGIWVITAKRKDKHERFVALDKLTFEMFDRLKGVDVDSPIFNWRGKPILRRSMKYVFKKYAKMAGIREALSIHCLRHFHATACVESDMSPQEVAARLGHSGLDMVMEYFTLREGRNREMADNVGGLIFGDEDS